MSELTLDHLVLRYCRQVVMQAMDHVRSRMREENIPYFPAVRGEAADAEIGVKPDEED